MTKEECLEALNYFYEEVSIDEYNTKLDDKNYQILEKLIGEHFDNPPLKFEEITEDEVPYWDKIEQTWCLVSGEGDEVCIYSIFETDKPKYITKYNFISKYENRFYRKQVEE